MVFVEFILALLPIIWLIIAMSALKWPAYKAVPVALVITIILAYFNWKFPFGLMGTAALEGVALALWPICLVIVAAMFTYNLCLKTGSMDIIKRLLTGVSKDKRVLLLIIGWAFGGFLEGMAGFGSEVAIPASMLAGLGFNPIMATVACLVANSTPTAFGSVGIPTITAANLTGIPILELAWDTVVQEFPLIILSPFIMILILGKSPKALKGVWPIALLSGLSFGLTELIVARFIGAELVVVLGSIVSIFVTILAAKYMCKDPDPEYLVESSAVETGKKIDIKEALIACLPFILIFILLIGTSKIVPAINEGLSAIKTSVQIYQGADADPYTFTWINTPGVLIFIAAIIGGLVQKASFKEIFGVLLDTLKQMSKTIITIVSIVMMAKIMGYIGMITSIAMVLVMITGSFYPLLAPFVGALGSFVTGSGTSTSVLFGGLQQQTAQSIGIAPAWLVAANSVGACIGKMISPQNVSIGAGATGLTGQESKLINGSVKWCALYIVIAGLITYFGYMFA